MLIYIRFYLILLYISHNVLIIFVQGPRGSAGLLLSGARSQVSCVLAHFIALQDQAHLNINPYANPSISSNVDPYFTPTAHTLVLLVCQEDGLLLLISLVYFL